MARTAAKANRRITGGYYVDGNTVRKEEYIVSPRKRDYERERRESLAAHRAQAKAAERTHAVNIAYLFFMVIALAAAAVILYFYISLQSAITTSAKNISYMEQELAELTQENDEAYNRIEGNVDLDEIRRIAIQEYGMRYIDEGQIITYSDGGGSDYVRQSADIPDAGD